MTQPQVSKLAWYSIALMILTSIHHAYGAIIYRTPWRLHVLLISIPVMTMTVLLKWYLLKKERKYGWEPEDRKDIVVFVLIMQSLYQNS